jgi:hypothetical protein
MLSCTELSIPEAEAGEAKKTNLRVVDGDEEV